MVCFARTGMTQRVESVSLLQACLGSNARGGVCLVRVVLVGPIRKTERAPGGSIRCMRPESNHVLLIAHTKA